MILVYRMYVILAGFNKNETTEEHLLLFNCVFKGFECVGKVVHFSLNQGLTSF